jgi:branched-chain amino acid transport system ATP-binding protein
MSALLQVTDIESFYGPSQALFGVTFDVRAREVVTLIGRNGMGKSTTVKSVMGIIAPKRGAITLGGEDIGGQPSYRIARRGVGLVPEGRHVFPTLTVRENLVATAGDRHRKREGAIAGDRRQARTTASVGADDQRPSFNPWTLDRVYDMFPRLKERDRNLGSNLSGGEQQMLAIGRALMTNPILLILDEATEGLAPLVRAEIWRCLAKLKDEGLSLIVIDKNIGPLLRLADRHFIVEKGRVVWSGDSATLKGQPELLHKYVGV